MLIQIQGTPVILGDKIDQKFQLYISNVGKREGVVSRSIAISAAKILLERDELFHKIKITETWAKPLLKRWGMLEVQKRNGLLKFLMV